MRLFLALLVRRAEADDGFANHQRGLFALGRGLSQCFLHRFGIVAVDHADHVPAVGFETLGRVVGEPAFHFTVDGDVVVVVDRDQLAQLPGTGERRHFVRDAFHQAAVADEHVGVMVDDGVIGAIEVRGQHLLRQREADRVGQTLPQRTGGGFHAWRVGGFRMTRRLGMQLAETLELVHRQIKAGEVQQRVLQHRAVAVGEHETIAIGPLGVAWVELQEVVPQHLGDIGHAHGHARMARIGCLHGIHG